MCSLVGVGTIFFGILVRFLNAPAFSANTNLTIGRRLKMLLTSIN